MAELQLHTRRRGRMTKGQARAISERGDHFRLTRFAECSAPIMLEVGFGMGQALVAFAASHPDWTCVGVDVYQPGIGSLILQCDDRALDNVRFVEDDVRRFVPGLPGESVRLIAVYFPDPWPKSRHHKRRLIQAPFVADAARVLEPGGRLLLATDWAPYADEMLAVLDAEGALVNDFGRGRFASRPPERQDTRFETRGRLLGHEVWDLAYSKRP